MRLSYFLYYLVRRWLSASRTHPQKWDKHIAEKITDRARPHHSRSHASLVTSPTLSHPTPCSSSVRPPVLPGPLQSALAGNKSSIHRLPDARTSRSLPASIDRCRAATPSPTQGRVGAVSTVAS
jgi:hypothetical protein